MSESEKSNQEQQKNSGSEEGALTLSDKKGLLQDLEDEDIGQGLLSGVKLQDIMKLSNHPYNLKIRKYQSEVMNLKKVANRNIENYAKVLKYNKVCPSLDTEARLELYLEEEQQSEAAKSNKTTSKKAPYTTNVSIPNQDNGFADGDVAFGSQGGATAASYAATSHDRSISPTPTGTAHTRPSSLVFESPPTVEDVVEDFSVSRLTSRFDDLSFDGHNKSTPARRTSRGQSVQKPSRGYGTPNRGTPNRGTPSGISHGSAQSRTTPSRGSRTSSWGASRGATFLPANFELQTPRKGSQQNPNVLVADTQNNRFNKGFDVYTIIDHIYNTIKHDVITIKMVMTSPLDYREYSMRLAIDFAGTLNQIPVDVLERGLMLIKPSKSVLLQDGLVLLDNFPRGEDDEFINRLRTELADATTEYEDDTNLDNRLEYTLIVFPSGFLWDNSIYGGRSSELLKRRVLMKFEAEHPSNFYRKLVKGSLVYFKIALCGGKNIGYATDDEDRDADFDV